MSSSRPTSPPRSTGPRVPRADLDPICCAADALALVAAAIDHPLAPETIGFFLDDRGVGNTITIVADTVAPDCVVDVAEVLSMVAAGVPGITSLVLATVRPKSGTLPGDIDRWLEASAIVEAQGVELLEWFVIGPAGPECPRDLLGEPERWPDPDRDPS